MTRSDNDMPAGSARLGRSILTLIAVSTTACQETADPETTPNTATLFPADDWIIARAYDPLRRVPEGFLVDERAETPRSYSLHHITDASNSYERCTDSFDTAHRWEAEDHSLRAVGGVYVGARENERYFEIIRELSHEAGLGNVEGMTSPGFARVFKCSYVRRDGTDRHRRDGYAGTLNEKPLSVGTVRDFAEYLWQFAFFPGASATVLETWSSESGSTLEHTLRIALLQRRDSSRCDRIDVFDWTYAASGTDGAVYQRYERRHRLDSKVVNGRAEPCTARGH